MLFYLPFLLNLSGAIPGRGKLAVISQSENLNQRGSMRAAFCSAAPSLANPVEGLAVRCAHGPRDRIKKRVRECIYRKQLDVDTLVCTRGPNFPLSRLEIGAHVSGLRKSLG